MEFTVSIMQSQLAEQVDRLRMTAYSSAKWFKLEDPQKVCLASDVSGTQVVCVMPLGSSQTVVATTAVRVCRTRQELEGGLAAEVPAEAFPLPAVLMTRLAVAENWQGQRLNLLLMKFKIEQALTAGIESICATQAKGTPNITGLLQLGFQYFDVVSSSGESVAVVAGTKVCCVLLRSEFPAALRQLAALLAAREVCGDWHGNPAIAAQVSLTK